jgi:hypothetical protein
MASFKMSDSETFPTTKANKAGFYCCPFSGRLYFDGF